MLRLLDLLKGRVRQERSDQQDVVGGIPTRKEPSPAEIDVPHACEENCSSQAKQFETLPLVLGCGSETKRAVSHVLKGSNTPDRST
jgi:hypothetical protein